MRQKARGRLMEGPDPLGTEVAGKCDARKYICTEREGGGDTRSDFQAFKQLGEKGISGNKK